MEPIIVFLLKPVHINVEHSIFESPEDGYLDFDEQNEIARNSLESMSEIFESGGDLIINVSNNPDVRLLMSAINAIHELYIYNYCPNIYISYNENNSYLQPLTIGYE